MTKSMLFNTEMVRAILDGRKSCTRRIIKDDVSAILNSPYHKAHPEVEDKQILCKLCMPPCIPGDILYVRETWNTYCEGCLSKNLENILGSTCNHSCGENGNGYYYKATDKNHVKWHPSIHMPKEAARIWLKVTDVRVERLQEITSEQIFKEGVEVEEPYVLNGEEKRYAFSNLWNSTIKKSDLDRYGWDANPWVWVISFERCEKPEDN